MNRTHKATTGVLVLVFAAVGLGFRLPQLDRRPMHGDEAVQAYKAGVLLDEGKYRYDPLEYHGPTLYYFAAAWARLTGHPTFDLTTERTFRLVPVIFGVALILLLWPLIDGLGRGPAVFAAALTAVSPALVFYSRYYIQEMLLVAFTTAAIAAAWRYTRHRSYRWAVATGLFLGLMHATKETAVIAFAAMAAAAALTAAIARKRDTQQSPPTERLNVKHLVAALAAAVAVSALFFSSFLTHPRGLVDAFAAYTHFLDRAGGAGLHRHPWHYYLKMLLYTHHARGPRWSEALILVLAVVGAASAFLRRQHPNANSHFIRFIAFYTLFMTVAYALIPYKTPWCMIGFLHGMILLAGVGAAEILRAVRGNRKSPLLSRRAGGAVVAALLLIGLAHLARQAYLANFRFDADIRNPYVYAHPVKGVLRLAQRAEDLAAVHPAGRAMTVKVVMPDGDYWPMPWYLRQFLNVGYWDAPPDSPDAPLIITSPEFKQQFDETLEGRYVTEFHGLRPGILFLTYIDADLWDAFMQTRR